MGLRLTYRRCRFWQKKIFFSYEADLDLGGYVTKQTCRIWGTKKPHAKMKRRRTQNEALFGADLKTLGNIATLL